MKKPREMLRLIWLPRLETNKKGKAKSIRLLPKTLILPPRSGLPTCQINISPNKKLNNKKKRRRNPNLMKRKKRRPKMMTKKKTMMIPMMMMFNNSLTTSPRRPLPRRERRLLELRKPRSTTERDLVMITN